MIVCNILGCHSFWYAQGSYIRRIKHRGTKADQGVIKQIFQKKDYSIDKLRRAEELVAIYQSIINKGKTPLIIDGGANIGVSAVWFSIVFPKSHLICFEPDQSNYSLLLENTKKFDVQAYQAAIGSEDGMVDLIGPLNGEWGYQVQSNPQGKIKMFSSNKIVSDKVKEGYVPFIVKIDIEGGEADLFSKNLDWIDRFPLLIIELHDWLFPKAKTSRSFLRAISKLDRDFVYKRENIFSIKN